METTQPGSLRFADGKDGVCEAAPRHQGRAQILEGKVGVIQKKTWWYKRSSNDQGQKVSMLKRVARQWVLV